MSLTRGEFKFESHIKINNMSFTLTYKGKNVYSDNGFVYYCDIEHNRLLNNKISQPACVLSFNKNICKIEAVKYNVKFSGPWSENIQFDYCPTKEIKKNSAVNLLFNTNQHYIVMVEDVEMMLLRNS